MAERLGEQVSKQRSSRQKNKPVIMKTNSALPWCTLGIGGPSGYAAIEVAKGHAEEGTPSPVAGLKGIDASCWWIRKSASSRARMTRAAFF